VTGGGSSIREVQALLRVLAAGRDVVELGTAFGDGAAALAETARTVVTVELDPERAALARGRLSGTANVELLEGDWRALLRDRGPFGLLFYDAGPPYDVDAALALLAPGGLLVKDDLTPGYDGQDVWRGLLRDPRFAAVEILTAPDAAAIVAVRR
jgi:protein-L-isoaspartate(D-aspartate) O-methyltransferase